MGVTSDPIADMLTRIRNATRARKSEVMVPKSKLKLELARVLVEEGYIASYESVPSEAGVSRYIRIVLKGGRDRRRQPVIVGIKRVSKPGLRIYSASDALPRVMGGLGVSVVSTSAGVMTDKQARAAGLGGEILAQIW